MRRAMTLADFSVFDLRRFDRRKRKIIKPMPLSRYWEKIRYDIAMKHFKEDFLPALGEFIKKIVEEPSLTSRIFDCVED